MKLVHEYVRSIALVSDTHILSRYGLCPEEYITDTGDNLGASMNKGQKKLLESWKSFCKTMDDFQVDTVFLAGDIIAGQNLKESGQFMMTTDLTEQVDAAAMLLAPLCDNRKVAVWSGTPYHESRDYKIHKALAKEFNGRFYGSICDLQILPTNKYVNVAHATTSAAVYPETVLSRDIMFLKEAEALGKLPKLSAVIRGHRHSYVEIHKHDLHYISLPCWEMFTPYYKATQWYFKMQPDIGGGLMLVDAEWRFRFFHFLYPCPRMAGTMVTG